MAKRMIIMLVAVGIVLGGVIGFISIRPMLIRHFIAAQPVATQTVSTTKAGYSEWAQTFSTVGSLRAVNGSDLSSEVAGIVEAIRFKSGDDVPAGTLLIQLRAEDDIAKLHSLQAQADLARITFERDRKQLKVRAISQATLDTDTANLKNAQALVEQQQVLVDKKSVRAPFAGRLGIRQVDLGQYLAAGTTMVTLQQLDPIYFDFTVPQQIVHDIAVGAKIRLAVDAFPGETFDGEVTAVGSKVDTDTRNLAIRARVPNPSHKLLPGMFGTITITTGTPKRLLTLPQTAVVYNTYGDSVYVVDDHGKGADGKEKLVARQTFVTTGAARGDQIAVLTGIKEGEVIVTAGQIKLHNGTPLSVNNEVLPADDPNPHPVEQ